MKAILLFLAIEHSHDHQIKETFLFMLHIGVSCSSQKLGLESTIVWNLDLLQKSALLDTDYLRMATIETS
jgi:hypothetical protein